MTNKQWPPERYRAVADAMQKEMRWIQLGLAEDPPIAGALDLRGRTTFRETAAILANSKIYLGEAGFLMHLARAVDCRSVIVYGGREDPLVSGYRVNENMVGRTHCSPCWQRSRCDYGHECMRMIDPTEVLAAIRRQLERVGTPLEVEQANLDLTKETLDARSSL
jgi:ADP-heptose:LPS heptosyltransferase